MSLKEKGRINILAKKKKKKKKKGKNYKIYELVPEKTPKWIIGSYHFFHTYLILL